MATVTRYAVAVVTEKQGIAAAVRTLLPNVDVKEILLTDKDVTAEELTNHVTAETVVLCDPPVLEQLVESDLPLKWAHSTWAGVETAVTIVRDKQVQPHFIFSRTGHCYGQLFGEYVVGHVIARERRFREIFKNNEQNLWERYFNFRPLTSLTIGILGLGQIGSEIARYCKGMGMTVWGLRRSQSSLCEHVDEMRGLTELTDLLSNCDYICSILPSTPETCGLLSGDVLSNCKSKKSVFINVGRGSVVDEDSLINALNQGWIGGAILDVFAKEPLPESSPLWSMENVTITCHCSGPSQPLQVAEGFVENYHLFCDGSPVKYQVDWSKGY